MHNEDYRGPEDHCLLPKVNTLQQEWTSRPALISPKGDSLGFHVVGLKYLFTWIPQYDWLDYKW